MSDNCGTCKQFILGNRVSSYFSDEGECKDRATVYMGSTKCNTFVRKGLFELLLMSFKYQILRLKCKIADIEHDMKW